DGIVASVDGVVTQLGGPAIDGLIATNASPGKTGMGGALLDRKGGVAGIVLGPIAGDSSTYALPMSVARRGADELGRTGTAAHGWLGVVGTDYLGSAVVTRTVANSPAARAGIRSGDAIVAVDGRSMTSMAGVTAAIRWYQPRSQVVVKVKRGPMLVKMHVT